MSLRKQFNLFSFMSYAGWRVIHLFVGVLSIALLSLHTGLASGHHLDKILLVDFLLLSFLGAITGYLIVIEPRYTKPFVWRLKSMARWGHVFLFWPLPILLAFHIFSIYYF